MLVGLPTRNPPKARSQLGAAHEIVLGHLLRVRGSRTSKDGEHPLSDPTEIPPPYRDTGVAIPLSHCVSCGIADYRCYTPISFLKNGLSQSKQALEGGGIAGKACL